MVVSNNISPGMVLSVNNNLYRVESVLKVKAPKGLPFMRTKLMNLVSNDLEEKNFKVDQTLKDVVLVERKLEFLYLEGKDYLFIDTGNLEQVLVPASVVGNQVNYLKEGVDVKAVFYGDIIFSVELPQFLELMVEKVEAEDSRRANSVRIAILESGARIEVPPFIEVGDIIKVDTRTDEYIQRV